ncbi:MAG TPA: YihY/virulence factor BrkB family protein [Bryobacteraceae bacterium]|jgi:membrane protein
MLNLWTLGGLSWRELLWRTARECWDDEVFGQAARLAFYHFLGLFPALLLTVLVLARLQHAGSDLLQTLNSSVQRILPAGASNALIEFLNDIETRTAGRGVWFAVVGSLWAAFNGTWAVMSALNDAYEVKEHREWWKIAAIAGGLTLTFALLGYIALAVLLLDGRFESATRFDAIWRVLDWIVVAILLLVAFAFLYRFGPDLLDTKIRWSTPGAAIAVALWVGASLTFRAYAEHAAASYGATYGSVANIVILMLWFYITGVAILIGGEANSEIENAAAQNGHPDARRPGERRPGGDRLPQKS